MTMTAAVAGEGVFIAACSQVRTDHDVQFHAVLIGVVHRRAHVHPQPGPAGQQLRSEARPVQAFGEEVGGPVLFAAELRSGMQMPANLDQFRAVAFQPAP